MNWVDNTRVDETEADKLEYNLTFDRRQLMLENKLTAHGHNCIILATPGEGLPLHWIAQLIIWQHNPMFAASYIGINDKIKKILNI